MIRRALAWALALAAVPAVASENPAGEFPDAKASDPARMGWMVGSPPPPDRIVRFDDGSYWRFPAMRWTVSNFRQLMPTVNVSRGLGPIAPLPTALRDDIDGVAFTPLGGFAAAEPVPVIADDRLDGREHLRRIVVQKTDVTAYGSLVGGCHVKRA